MKIFRTINGYPEVITLSNDELRRAYKEQQKFFDVLDAKAITKDVLEWKDFPDQFVEEIFADDGFFEVVAERFRDDHDWSVADFDAMEYIVDELLEQEYDVWDKQHPEDNS